VTRFRRAPALLFSAAVVAATLWPALRDPPVDSFPLSTYPMFSTVPESAWLDVIVGFDAAGMEHRIPPQLVANYEVMQAAQTIRLAVRRQRAPQLCDEVAARVADDPDFAHVVQLEVQRRKFDPLTYFTSPPSERLLDLRRKARCRVRPGSVFSSGRVRPGSAFSSGRVRP
jgi:hypothetical protein